LAAYIALGELASEILVTVDQEAALLVGDLNSAAKRLANQAAREALAAAAGDSRISLSPIRINGLARALAA
jgi:hypothetical protein